MNIAVIAGIMAGVLFAPKAGDETRADIVSCIRDLLENGTNAFKKPQKKNTAKNFIIGTAVGVAAGLAAGLLFAPQSGKETREDIHKIVSNT